MPVTFMPLQENIKEHLTNFHITDKPTGGFTSPSNKFAVYTPSKEETIKIANLIERHTGLKLDEKTRRGDLKISFISRDEAFKLSRDYHSSLLRELKLEQTAYDYLFKRITKTLAEDYKTVNGYYHRLSGAIYLVNENLEGFIKDWSVGLIKRGVIAGKLEGIFRKKPDEKALERTTKFAVLGTTTHESVHKTLNENNPMLERKTLVLAAQRWALSSKLPEVNEKEGEKIAKSILSLDSQINAIKIFDEAIAYFVEHRVMCDMGFSAESSLHFANLKKQRPDIAKGIAFFEEVEHIANKNPIPLVYKNLPVSMHEIENPKAYLRRTTGWRV